MDEGWVAELEREIDFLESKGANEGEDSREYRRGIFILETPGRGRIVVVVIKCLRREFGCCTSGSVTVRRRLRSS